MILYSVIAISVAPRATNPWGLRGHTREVLVCACLVLTLLPTHLLLADARLELDTPCRCSPPPCSCFLQGTGISLCHRRGGGPRVLGRVGKQRMVGRRTQAARVVRLPKGVGASTSLPGDPRLGGFQMAPGSQIALPQEALNFQKRS